MGLTRFAAKRMGPHAKILWKHSHKARLVEVRLDGHGGGVEGMKQLVQVAAASEGVSDTLCHVLHTLHSARCRHPRGHALHVCPRRGGRPARASAATRGGDKAFSSRLK